VNRHLIMPLAPDPIAVSGPIWPDKNFQSFLESGTSGIPILNSPLMNRSWNIGALCTVSPTYPCAGMSLDARKGIPCSLDYEFPFWNTWSLRSTRIVAFPSGCISEVSNVEGYKVPVIVGSGVGSIQSWRCA
jgi:hypothetical protein